ncbi:hypothetical protein CEXT_512111 [Caerostris extrusa]|uniref:Uncharacterized protein n=1 Tax=Caerostris extrusa TaxID=172846 RepID=A0AAV4XB13_CAEEX|nr:hypothetical protein CEXT_512111 [Caerostris extrusa]
MQANAYGKVDAKKEEAISWRERNLYTRNGKCEIPTFKQGGKRLPNNEAKRCVECEMRLEGESNKKEGREGINKEKEMT